MQTLATIQTLRRARLAEAIARMSTAIDQDDDSVPSLDELRAVAAVCEEHHLPAEAARVRRWMGQA